MHFFVTGGTEGIGRALVLELLQKQPDNSGSVASQMGGDPSPAPGG